MCFVVGWGRTNFQFQCQRIFRNKQQSNYLKITKTFISDEICITGSNYTNSQCGGKKMIRTRPSRTQKVNKINSHSCVR